jgi:hypothetical protein
LHFPSIQLTCSLGALAAVREWRRLLAAANPVAVDIPAVVIREAVEGNHPAAEADLTRAEVRHFPAEDRISLQVADNSRV